MNLAGTFLALGIAIAALSWFGVRNRHRWAWGTAVVLPLTFLSLSLGVHTTVSFDYYTLTHLGPAGVGAPIFVVGAVPSYYGLRTTAATDATGSDA